MRIEPPRADIALLVEGTYPYVRGGVSSWIHQIITGLPEFSFSLLFLGSTPSAYAEAKYEVPGNVVHVEKCFLMDEHSRLAPGPRRLHGTRLEDVQRLHDSLLGPGHGPDTGTARKVLGSLVAGNGLEARDFFFSQGAWTHIQASYLGACRDAPFLEYFWTLRSIIGPVFKLSEFAKRMPPVRLFHAISTGYAGFLGALLQSRVGAPLMLTEHGIYTKERRIDIQTLNLKCGGDEPEPSAVDGMAYSDHLWIRFFENLGRFTYQAADPIISLYERNRQRQVSDGAEAARTRIVPNGVDLEGLSPLRAKRPESVPPVIGLLGRIVPIKDVKTFIRAMKTVTVRLPQAEAWLIGPTEEDPTYVEECRSLISDLGLEQQVKFLGFQNPKDILPQLGLMVLSSISEAFPLVLLEAFAAGLPAVTTDVGACREIIEGRDADDRAIGSAGRVVAFADPDGLAKAVLELLGNQDAWRRAQGAAIERVERYYNQERILGEYRELYKATMAA